MTAQIEAIGLLMAFGFSMLLVNIKVSSTPSRFVSFTAMWAAFVVAAVLLARVVGESW